MQNQSVKFYHGTDARIVRMKKDERLAFREMVEEIIKTLWPVYQPYVDCSVDNAKYKLFVLLDRNESLFDYVWTRLNYFAAQQLNNKLYQYQKDGLYVRKEMLFANNYANIARYFGEIGSIAYAMAYPIEKIQDISEFALEFKCKLNKFLDFCNQVPEPVVFEFDIESPEYLIDEDGMQVPEWMFFDSIDAPSWRLVKNVDLSHTSYNSVEIDNVHFNVNPYEYEEIPYSKIRTLKRGDRVRIINDCEKFPKAGELCMVMYSKESFVGVIPCHHNQLFEVPIKNICLLRRK